MPRPKRAKLYSFALLIEGKNPLVIPFSAVNQIALEEHDLGTIRILYTVRERVQEIHFAASHLFGIDRSGTFVLYQHLQSAFSRYVAAHRQESRLGTGRRTLLVDLALQRQAGSEFDLFLADLAQVEPGKGEDLLPVRERTTLMGNSPCYDRLGSSPQFVSSADYLWNAA